MATQRPAEVWAIDWGADAKKRQRCRAVLRGGRYSVEAPSPVSVEELRALPDGVLVGFDCPLGVTDVYAAAAGLTGFRAALREFGRGRFERFFEVCGSADEVDVTRPFFPRGSKATRDLHDKALGRSVARGLRRCDVATGGADLFWTLGPKQVGRSAITVWRDILGPQLDAIALWPFDGPLSSLLSRKRAVVAELYPGHFQRFWLGMPHHSKRKQDDRKAMGAALLAKVTGVDLAAVRGALLDGFGAQPDGEDPFDATLGCLGLLDALAHGIPEPDDAFRLNEGWILGL